MRLAPLSPGRVIKALEELGFKKIRQKGSHCFFRHDDGRTTVVPLHKGELIGRGLLRKIIRDADITKDKFLKLLK